MIEHVNVDVKRKGPNNGIEIQYKWNHYQGLLNLETKSQIHVHLTSLRNLVLGLDYLDQGCCFELLFIRVLYPKKGFESFQRS